MGPDVIWPCYRSLCFSKLFTCFERFVDKYRHSVVNCICLRVSGVTIDVQLTLVHRSTTAHANLISCFLATSVSNFNSSGIVWVCYDRGPPARSRSGQVLWFRDRLQPQPQVCGGPRRDEAESASGLFEGGSGKNRQRNLARSLKLIDKL